MPKTGEEKLVESMTDWKFYQSTKILYIDDFFCPQTKVVPKPLIDWLIDAGSISINLLKI